MIRDHMNSIDEKMNFMVGLLGQQRSKMAVTVPVDTSDDENVEEHVPAIVL